MLHASRAYRRLAVVTLVLVAFAATTALSLGCTATDVPAEYAAEIREQPRSVVVERSASVLHYYEQGERIRSMPVVVGAPNSPTPLGVWRIWKSEEMDSDGAYGSWRLSIEYSVGPDEWERGAFGVHGTNEPGLLARPAPRRYSNGCIRLSNDDILWLAKRMKGGDRVYVAP